MMKLERDNPGQSAQEIHPDNALSEILKEGWLTPPMSPEEAKIARTQCQIGLAAKAAEATDTPDE